jgi:hypothetical protein
MLGVRERQCSLLGRVAPSGLVTAGINPAARRTLALWRARTLLDLAVGELLMGFALFPIDGRDSACVAHLSIEELALISEPMM